MNNDFLIALLATLLVLIIEYSVFKPIENLPKNQKKRWFNAIIASVVFFAPLFLLRILSLRFSLSIGASLTTINRVDIYTNVYGILALLWGNIWATYIRPWVKSLMEKQP